MLNASGNASEAIQAFEEAIRCSKGGAYAVGQLAYMLARSGDRPRAERELQSLLDRSKLQWVPGSVAEHPTSRNPPDAGRQAESRRARATYG